MFNFDFVARTPLAALQNEIVHVSAIPYCYERLERLELELATYREAALANFHDDEMRMDHDFRQQHALLLPTWWEFVLEIALITPSSCTDETMRVNRMDE